MLILVRHGESTGNAQGLLLGRIDAALTEFGQAQAAAVGPLLGAPVAELRTSPLARARHTAAALALGGGGPDRPALDRGGLRASSTANRCVTSRPASGRSGGATRGYRPSGGETLAEVDQRVAGACDELFAQPDAAGARRTEPTWWWSAT